MLCGGEAVGLKYLYYKSVIKLMEWISLRNTVEEFYFCTLYILCIELLLFQSIRAKTKFFLGYFSRNILKLKVNVCCPCIKFVKL